MSNRRVLIVDDQTEIHDDFREMLSSLQAAQASDELAATFVARPGDSVDSTSFSFPGSELELLHAASGEEAFEIVQQGHDLGEPVALAYVDVRMPPRIDGVETVSRLRTVDPDIEVVMMTAYSDMPLPAIVGDPRLWHKLLYIRKPFIREEIQQLTMSLLKKWQVEHSLAASHRRLAESHQRLQAVLDATGDAIAMYDGDDRLVFANRSYEKLLDEPADTLRALPRSDALARFRESSTSQMSTANGLPGGGAVVEPAGSAGSTDQDAPLFYRAMHTVRDTAEKNIGEILVYRDLSRETRIERISCEVERLRAALETTYSFDGIVGTSRRLRSMCEAIKQVLDADITVLVRGETGTGKELVAKALHFNSRRRKQPFLAINCAALPETLVESELFGHERGAFSGATRQRAGCFEQASGGTLLLDEIGDMTLTLQAKLLRVLQEREIRRLGGNRVIPVDVRVIAATNRNLNAAIRERTFREDLFYRLAEVLIEVPPLRERREDIPLLAKHFLEKHASRVNKSVRGLSAGASTLLVRHSWPGNVRELENVICGALVRETSDMLQAASLPAEQFVPAAAAPAPAPLNGCTLADIERRAIADAIESTGGNLTRAARLLGISRATLHRKLKRDRGE